MRSILNKEYIKKWKEPSNIFIIGWAIFLISQFMSNSMLKYELPDILLKFMLLLSYVLISIKFLIYDLKYYLSSIKINFNENIEIVDREVFFRVCTITLLSLTGISLFVINRDSSIIKLVILLLGATNIDLKKIIRSYFWIILTGMIIMIVLSQLAIVENLVYGRGDGSDTVRNSFGLLYPTNFSARIFILTLCYSYLNDFKLKWWELVSIGLVTYMTLVTTDGRLDVYSILLILIIILVKKMNTNYQRLLSCASLFVIPFSIIFTFITTVFYNPENKLFFILNRLLSGRLRLGREAFSEYNPFTLFGQVIESNGWGGLEGKNLNLAEYFYIDSSYLKILFYQGVVVFVIMIMIIIYSQYKFFMQKKYNIVFVFALMGIYSIVSEFLIKPEYFPFILALYATVNEEKNDFEIDQISN